MNRPEDNNKPKKDPPPPPPPPPPKLDPEDLYDFSKGYKRDDKEKNDNGEKRRAN